MPNAENEMETGFGASPAAALPVKKIFLEALALPARQLRVIGRLSSPFLVILALIVVGSPSLPTALGFGANILLTSLAFVLFSGFAAILATVACHRVFIEGPESMADHKLVWWSSRETSFAGWLILISILGALIVLAMGLLLFSPILSALVMGGEKSSAIGMVALSSLLALPAAYVIGRSSLVLPATAIDEKPSMAWAWAISDGNGLRLMVLIGFLPILLDSLFSLLPATRSILYNSIYWTVYLYVAAVEIAILSLSYRHLVNSKAEKPTTQ